LGSKEVGPARGPVKLGSARGAARGSARPAAQQAGSGSGPATREKRLGLLLPWAGFLSFLGWALFLSFFSSGWAGAPPSPLLLLFLHAGCSRLCPLLLSLTAWSHWSAPAGSGVVARIRCDRKCACVWVGRARRRVRCGRPRGARGKAPKTRPRRERDVAVASRGGRARRGRGAGVAKLGPRQQHGMARARSGVRAHARGAWLPRAAAWPCRARSTGDPGPRHDAAARGRRR
jgi:hypothetical protein